MKRHGALTLLLLIGVAACDESEEPNEDAPATAEQPMQEQMDPETMQQMMEIQEIQQQLEPIQQEAMQDEEIAGRLQAIQGQIEVAMREENSELVDRMESFQAEMAEAQGAGDQQRMQQLMAEAQQLQPQVQALQTSILERPEIREQVEAFEAAHRARMIEIDPEAEALLDRLDELVASLS